MYRNKSITNTPINFIWSLSTSYENIRNCNEECHSICRCGVIEGVEITKVHLDEVLNSVKNSLKAIKESSNKLLKYKPSDIEWYCIKRLASVYKIHRPEAYKVKVSGGYYGEEISGIFLKDETFFNAVDEMLNTEEDKDKIFYTLNAEYSYIVDSIESATGVRIVDHSVDKLIKSRRHAENVKRESVRPYQGQDYKSPIALVFNDRLIDGYHRVCQALEDQKDNIKVVELYE